MFLPLWQIKVQASLVTNPDWDVGTHGGRDRERIAISTLKAWPKGLKYLIVCFLVRTEMTIFEVDAWHWELLFNDCYQRKKFLHWRFFSWTQSAKHHKNLIQHENYSTVMMVLQIFAMVEGVAQLGSSIPLFQSFWSGFKSYHQTFTSLEQFY